MLIPRHKSFLIVEQGIVPMVVNFLLNGLIAWLLFQSAEAVPIWGDSSVGVDTLATAFLLPFLTCLIVSAIVSGQCRAGKIPALPQHQMPITGFYKMPAFLRALLLGAIAMVLFALPLVWALSLGQAQAFAVSSFIVFKASFAAMLAMVFTPISGWWALASASSTQQA